MPNYAPVAARAVRRQNAPVLTPVSRFRWQARFGDLDALTGQTGTLLRAATGTALDANGTTYTAGHSMPRWEARDYNATGFRDTLGLRLAADDLTYLCNWTPERATLLIEFSEAGTRTTAGAGLVYLGNDGQTGARLIVDASTSQYRATIHNGTTSQSVSLATSTPTTDQTARLVVQLDDDGTNQRVRLILRIGTGSDTTTAYSSTVTRAAAWGTDAKVRLNRVGSAGTQGSTWVRQVAWCAGLLTIDEMVARL
jgi:hypothetical protein